MSINRITADLQGKDGSEVISNFATIGDSSAALVGATLTSSGAVAGTTGTFTDTLAGGGTYIKVGSHKYIIFGTLAIQASIEALGTALDASIAGSMYSGRDGLWFFTTDEIASVCTM